MLKLVQCILAPSGPRCCWLMHPVTKPDQLIHRTSFLWPKPFKTIYLSFVSAGCAVVISKRFLIRLVFYFGECKTMPKKVLISIVGFVQLNVMNVVWSKRDISWSAYPDALRLVQKKFNRSAVANGFWSTLYPQPSCWKPSYVCTMALVQQFVR